MRTSQNPLSLLLVLILVTLTGCHTAGRSSGISREAGGTAVGAVLGGAAGRVIGKDTTGTAVGALAGAFIGNRIGARLDTAEQEALNQVTHDAIMENRPVIWETPNDPSIGDSAFASYRRDRPQTRVAATPVTPPRRQSDGKTCQVIRQSVMKDGQRIEDDLTVCSGTPTWE